MNPETGEIKRFLDKEEAKRQGFTVPLTDNEAAALLGLGGARKAMSTTTSPTPTPFHLVPPLSPRDDGRRNRRVIGGKVFKKRAKLSRLVLLPFLLLLALTASVVAHSSSPHHAVVGMPDEFQNWTVRDGDAGDPGTWGNGLPGADQNVFIKHRVAVSSLVTVDNICVDGTVTIQAGGTLAARMVCVCENARFIGMAGGGFMQRAMGFNVEDPKGEGNGIIADGNAAVIIDGELRTGHVEVLGGLPRGRIQILLAQPVIGWRPGLRVVIPNTGATGALDEVRVIKSVAPDGRSIDVEPLSYEHPSTTDPVTGKIYNPRVMLIDHSFRFWSEDPAIMRGQIKVTEGAWADIRYASIDNFGRVTLLTPTDGTAFGVYPAHFHHLNEWLVRPLDCTLPEGVRSRVLGGAITNAMRWAGVAHQSSGVLFDGVVVFKAIGIGINLSEDGGREKHNAARGCMIAGVTGKDGGQDYSVDKLVQSRNKFRGIAQWALVGAGINLNAFSSATGNWIYGTTGPAIQYFNVSPLVNTVDAAGAAVNISTAGQTIDGYTAQVSGNVAVACNRTLQPWGAGTPDLDKSNPPTGAARTRLEIVGVRSGSSRMYATNNLDLVITTLKTLPVGAKSTEIDNRLNARHDGARWTIRSCYRETGVNIPEWFNGEVILDPFGCTTAIGLSMQSGNQTPAPMQSVAVIRAVRRAGVKPLLFNHSNIASTTIPRNILISKRTFIVWTDPAGSTLECWQVFSKYQLSQQVVWLTSGKRIGLPAGSPVLTNEQAFAQLGKCWLGEVAPANAQPVPGDANAVYVVVPESAVPPQGELPPGPEPVPTPDPTPTPAPDPTVIEIAATRFTSTVARGAWAWSETAAGMTALPNAGGYVLDNPAVAAPELSYTVTLPAGEWAVSLRGVGATLADDSCHVSIDGNAAVKVDGFAASGTTRAVPGTAALPGGEHNVKVYMREDGFTAKAWVFTRIGGGS